MRIDGVGFRRNRLQRISVGRSPRDRRRADVPVRADAVLNDNGLSQPRRQLLADDAGGHVDHAAGRPSNDDLQRPLRIFRMARNSDEDQKKGRCQHSKQAAPCHQGCSLVICASADDA